MTCAPPTHHSLEEASQFIYVSNVKWGGLRSNILLIPFDQTEFEARFEGIFGNDKHPTICPLPASVLTKCGWVVPGNSMEHPLCM